jgi:hypothetical protein
MIEYEEPAQNHPYSGKEPSAADLKFPQHLQQALAGTSNRKAAIIDG